MDMDQKTMPEATVLLVILTTEWTWPRRVTGVAKSLRWECHLGLNFILGNTCSSLWIKTLTSGAMVFPPLTDVGSHPEEARRRTSGSRRVFWMRENLGVRAGTVTTAVRQAPMLTVPAHSWRAADPKMQVWSAPHPRPLAQAHAVICRPLFFCLKHEVFCFCFFKSGLQVQLLVGLWN